MIHLVQQNTCFPGCKVFFKIHVIFITLIFSVSGVQAQQITKLVPTSNPLYQKYYLEVAPHKTYSISTEHAFSGVVFKIENQYSFTNAYIYTTADTSVLSENQHNEGQDDGHIYSNLVVFDQLKEEIVFHSGNINGEVFISFFNGKSSRQYPLRMKKHQQEQCEKPSAIDQTEWRAGLPEPSYNRIFTDVQHLIVHHSATDNSLTDYTNLVRNIYLFHTQDRGWSDIGYNYLIAPDGSLYQGRDPGSSGLQDNVMGAHFCGSNSTTMGICVLGTYTDINPTEESINTLTTLMAWKLDKERLNPLANGFHPTNQNLGVIAGHRDGCATLCPGDLIYQQIPQIKQTTATKIADCREEDQDAFIVYPTYVQNIITISKREEYLQKIKIMDMKGQVVYFLEPNSNNSNIELNISDFAAGVYALQLLFDTHSYEQLFFKK